MAAVLANSPSVRELHLSGNALGDVGATALVKGAVTGRRLRGDNDNASTQHLLSLVIFQISVTLGSI